MKKYYKFAIMNCLRPKTKIISIVFSLIFLSSCLYQNQSSTHNLPKTLIPLNTSETPQITETPIFSGENNSSTKQPSLGVLSQNGISIELNWIYADKFRVAIEYKVIGVEIPQGYQLPCPVQSISTSDNLSSQYDSYQYGYGNTEHLLTNCILNPDGSFIVTHNFYLSNLVEQKEIELNINIVVGGMQVTAENGVQTTIPNYGNFYFSHKLTNNGIFTLTPNQKINFNGLTTTLNRLEINPSLINSYMCINYDNKKEWYPKSYLLIEGEKIYADPTLIFRTDLKGIDLSNWFNQFTTERCYRFTFFSKNGSFIEDIPTNITVSLENLEINILDAATQEDCNIVKNKIQKEYPDLNFSCQIDDRDGGYGVLLNITSTPLGMSNETAYQVIEENFKQTISGPWLFTINFP